MTLREQFQKELKEDMKWLEIQIFNNTLLRGKNDILPHPKG